MLCGSIIPHCCDLLPPPSTHQGKALCGNLVQESLCFLAFDAGGHRLRFEVFVCTAITSTRSQIRNLRVLRRSNPCCSLSGDCQEKIALVDLPIPINSDQDEYSNDSDCSRLEHNHESCCIKDNKDDPASAIENDQNKELLCSSSANKTCTIRSFSSIAEENDDDDASSKSHCYRKMRPDGVTTLFGEKRIPNLMEQSIRAYSKDKTVTLLKPEVGMIFGSASEGYQFYNLYSWVLGFSIRSDDSYTNTKGERTMQEFRCQREGIYKKTKISSTRCGCRARLRLLRSNDLLWYVKIFNEQHNHDLVESCGQKKHLFSHRHIDDSTKTMVRHLRENNVSLSRINGIVGSFYGRADGVPFTKKALRTLCSDIAAEALKDDVRKTIEGFRDNIAQDNRFVFSMQLDANKNLRSLMWTSGPSRALYSHFGDVVTFDTTYETNIYKMPFGMFVGVNNHFQSVIFAGVLLTNETAEYFDWAFKEFVLMMGGKAPCTMLTDQALAMAVAIKRTLPTTTHRWCKWHVLRRAQEVLGHVYKNHLSFGDDFNMVVNHMLTIDEFERAWDFLIEKYNLRSNPFMTRAYECRDKWAKPYFNGVFCARMTSTQHSESANHVLKIYIPAQSSLNVFVKQYTKLISQREKDDNEAEKNTSQRSIKLTMRYPIEHHAYKIYTISVYKLFLQELLKSSSYIVTVLTDGALYEVRHVESSTREAWSRVIFNIEISCNGQFYKCECGLYSHFGILCCHALRVMLHLGVCKIPDLHIMKRWTRHARSTVPANLVEPNVEKGPVLTKEFRHDMIHMATIEIPSLGDHDNETYDIVMRNIERLKKEVPVYMSSISTTCQIGYGSHQSSEDVNSSHNSVMDDCSDADSSQSLCIVDENSNKSIPISSIKAPPIKKKKGRNHNSRYKSRLEGIIRKQRPLPAIDETCKQPGGQSGVHQIRFCGYCRGKGHDIRTCETRLQDGVEITPKRRKKCNGIPERCI